MHVLIGDQKVNLTQGSSGRLQATFTATDDTQSIRIPSNCIGTLNVNDIQLEQGEQATPFVEPAVQSEDMSGIFKDLHDLRIDIKDTEEGLSHQITINQEGLEQLISNTEERLNSRITLTAGIWQGKLSDTEEGLSNQITATAGLWQTRLSDTERGLRSIIQSKADSLIALIEDTEEGLSNQIVVNQEGLEQLISNTESRLDSRITLTADTWQGELSDAKRGLNNQITATASLWQTKLSDTERGLQSTIQSKADSLIRLIEDTDSNNFSKTEQLVSGLRTTVQGDLRSQRTQLENLISSSIESATGSRSSIWQTLNSHGSQISNAQGDISRVEQTISGYSRRISDIEGNYSSIEQTVSGLNTEVNGYFGGVQSRFRQLEGLIDARVTRDDLTGIISNSGDAILAGLKGKGGDMIAELNLSAGGVRLAGKNIFLDSNVTWTSDFRASFGSFLELSADQITSGTIDAAQIRVINLDVNSITGNITNFIQSYWNSAAGGSVRITGNGFQSTAPDLSQILIQNGNILVRNPGGNTVGEIGYKYANMSPYLTIAATHGSHIRLTSNDGSGDQLLMEASTAKDGVIFHYPVRIHGNLRFGWNHYIYGHDEWRLNITGAESIGLRANERTIFAVSNSGNTNHASLLANLNMNGNTITNQSDARLKTNIRTSYEDSLGKFKQISYKHFEYRKGHNLAGGVHHGVIAQDLLKFAPEWVLKDEEGYYSLNNSAMQMDGFKAITDLVRWNIELESRIEELENKLERVA